jgi:hypothetical protein
MSINLATLDIVSVLRRELKTINDDGTVRFECPMSTVAALAGVSSGKMSAYMNASVRVPHEHDIKLRRTWTSLKKLLEYAYPVPVDLRKIDRLRRSIDAMEDGSLQIVVLQTKPEPESIVVS